MELVLPIQRGTHYILELGELQFEIDPAAGGRVSGFSHRGRNILTTASVNAENWGSTFWTSPQSDWGWPPPAEYNIGAYAATVEGQTLVLTSAPTRVPYQLRVIKRFWADVVQRAIVLEYTVRNEGARPATVAGWEISRHAPGGLTFFPTGRRVVKDQLPVRYEGGLTWYENDPAAVVGVDGDKHIADAAEGWMAHTDGVLLLVKTFSDLTLAQQAPGEGEAEIYANKPATPESGAYVEVEVQGPYAPIASGASATWTVRWFLTTLSADVPSTVGSVPLVRLARELAKGSRVPASH